MLGTHLDLSIRLDGRLETVVWISPATLAVVMMKVDRNCLKEIAPQYDVKVSFPMRKAA